MQPPPLHGDDANAVGPGTTLMQTGNKHKGQTGMTAFSLKREEPDLKLPTRAVPIYLALRVPSRPNKW